MSSRLAKFFMRRGWGGRPARPAVVSRRIEGGRDARPTQTNHQYGAFTLVETIATMVILAVVMTASAQLISVAADGYADTAERSRLQADLSVAMDRIVRELQQMPQGSTGGTPSITSLTATSVAWDSTSSIVLLNGTLRLTTPETTWTPLIENVSAFSLTAYDQSNAQLGASLSGSSCQPIRRIAITLSVTHAGVTETLRTKVFLRCCAAGSGNS